MVDDSTDLFQRLSLDESLRRTVAVYKSGFLVFSKLAFAVVGVNALVWVLFLLVLMPLFHVDGSQFKDPSYLIAHMGSFYALLGIKMLVGMMIGAVGNGAMIRAVADLYLGREPSFQECLQVGARRGTTILCASFLGFWGIVVGLILLVFPGLYLSVKWFLVSPAIVVEGLGVFASFKRSSNLVSGSWCYVFCTFLIAYIFMLVVQMVWSAIFVGGNDASHTILSVGGSILASIPGIVIVPVFAIMMSIMYINLRIEKEGLNADLLARNLGEESSGGTATYSPLIADDADDEMA